MDTSKCNCGCDKSIKKSIDGNIGDIEEKIDKLTTKKKKKNKKDIFIMNEKKIKSKKKIIKIIKKNIKIK